MDKKMSGFGTDGIRALAGKYPLTKEGVHQIGFAAGLVLRKKTNQSRQCRIIIGRDTRQSGIWIEKTLTKGLSRSGCEVFSCGIIPTSAIAAILQEAKHSSEAVPEATHSLRSVHLRERSGARPSLQALSLQGERVGQKKNFLGGIIISASHNPAEFNGIKFFSSSGKKLPDSWEKEIEAELSKDHKFKSSPLKNFGPKDFSQAHDLYIQFLKDALPPSFNLQGLRWVVDCSNGSASHIAPRLLRSFGAEVIAIHNHPNGKNINLNCGTLHPQSLQKEILKQKANGGCAFDGDADRVQFIDEKGNLQDGDILLDLIAKSMKKNGKLKNNCVVTTVMANFGFFKKMKESKVRVITTAVGDRAVSEALESSQALLGGEQSGHIIFREFLPTGDGLLTMLKVLDIVRKSGRKLSSFTESFQKFPQLLLNLKVKEKIPIDHLPELKKTIQRMESQLDGNGRILVRYSGTEPLLRIMVEGQSHQEVRKMANEIAQVAKDVLQS